MSTDRPTPPASENPPPKPFKPCPNCGKPADPRHFPFCSARCSDVDLHRWLGGTYVISTSERPPDDVEE